MTVTYPSTSNDFTFTSGSATQNPVKPPNTADGDLLIAVTSGRNGAFSSIGSGWTTLISDYTTSGTIGHAAIHYLKVPTAASLPASWTFTFAEARASVLIFRVAGADLGSTFPGTATGFNATNSPVMTVPSATSAGSGFSVSFTYFQEFDLAVPNNPFGNGSWATLYNVGLTGSNRQAIVVAAGNDGGSGSTNSFTVTLDGQWPIETVGQVSNQAAVAVVGLTAASAGTQFGQAALSAPGSLSATARLTRPGTAHLSASPALAATAFLTRKGAASLAAAPALTAVAAGATVPAVAHLAASPALAATGRRIAAGTAHLSASPALGAIATVTMRASAHLAAVAFLAAVTTAPAGGTEDLWVAYLAAQQQASAAWEQWRMMRQAGGTDGTAGFLFGRAYEAQAASEQAYEAWRVAQAAARPGVTG